jgi:hypothetical protein
VSTAIYIDFSQKLKFYSIIKRCNKCIIHHLSLKRNTKFPEMYLFPHKHEKDSWTSDFYVQVIWSSQSSTGNFCNAVFRKQQAICLRYKGIKSDINNICVTSIAFSMRVLRMRRASLPSRLHIHRDLSWRVHNRADLKS